MAKTIAVALILLLGCNKKTDFLLEEDDQKLFEVTLIFKEKCLHCHEPYKFKTNREWVNSELVVPRNLENSLIYTSLRGVSVAGRKNMPINKQEILSEKELDAIKDWINSLKEINYHDKEIEINFKGEKISNKIHVEKCVRHITQKYYPNVSYTSCNAIVDSLTLKRGEVTNDKFILSALRNFQFVHNSFYKSYNFNKNNESWGTFELFDSSEAAYGLTASLFLKAVDYNQIFQGKKLYGPIRVKEKPSVMLVSKRDDKIKLKKDKFLWLNGNDDDNPKKWSPYPDEVERGQIKGFKQYSLKRNLVFQAYKSVQEPTPLGGIFNLHDGHGGGILGSTVYTMLNYSNNFFQVMDDKRFTMRSWSKAIFNDYLCRNLPVIFKYDALASVDIKSDLPFNRSVNCMQCHKSIDPMAKALSFVSLGHNNTIAKRIDLKSEEIGALHTIFPIDVRKSMLNDKYKSNEKGALIYRNYEGKLINLKFENINDLGLIMLKQLDPYICITKNYLEYFTNLTIDLDQLIKNRNQHSAKEKYIYDEIITLGKKLNKNQSLKSLIKTILSHNLYLYKDNQIQVKYKND
mgnify:FL=1